MVDRYVPQTVSPRIVEQIQRLHRSVDAIQRTLTAERQAPQRELMAAAIVEGQRIAHRQPTPQIDAVGRPLEQPQPVVDDRLAGALKALGRKPRSQEELHEALWAHDETLQSDQLIARSLEYQAAHGRLPSVPNPAPDDAPHRTKLENLTRVGKPLPDSRTKILKAARSLEGAEGRRAAARKILTDLERGLAALRRR